MIEFSDQTLRLYNGYREVCEIMKLENPHEWMLRSEVFVNTETIYSRFVVNFWSNGRAVLSECDHPPIIEIPDDDFIAFRDWCNEKEWKFFIHNRLTEDASSFSFWLRLFRAGIVHSEYLEEYEKEELKRFQKAFSSKKEEE